MAQTPLHCFFKYIIHKLGKPLLLSVLLIGALKWSSLGKGGDKVQSKGILTCSQ